MCSRIIFRFAVGVTFWMVLLRWAFSNKNYWELLFSPPAIQTCGTISSCIPLSGIGRWGDFLTVHCMRWEKAYVEGKKENISVKCFGVVLMKSVTPAEVARFEEASLTGCWGKAKGQGQVLVTLRSASRLTTSSTQCAEDAHAEGRWAGLLLTR